MITLSMHVTSTSFVATGRPNNAKFGMVFDCSRSVVRDPSMRNAINRFDAHVSEAKQAEVGRKTSPWTAKSDGFAIARLVW